MIVAQLSDTHTLVPADDCPVAAGRSENLRCCVGDINSLDPQPDAVLHTGDMTHQGRDGEFNHAREILVQLKAPLFVTPGNRDGREGLVRAFAGEAWLAGNPPFIQYAVDDFAVRLVCVDSLSSDVRKGDLCASRLQILDATLSEAPDRPTG